MMTRFLQITKNQEKDSKIYEEAGELLKAGELVAFPTETVYGLGGDALNCEAAHKIYAAKGRPSDNPLIVHIADVHALNELCEKVPDSAKKLAEAFWPGPLTMVLKKKDIVPYETTGGLDTVAVRMPNHPVALQLIRESGVYIAAPSANLSGRPSPTNASHVKEDLDGKIGMIIDGGAVSIGIESTIIDLTEETPMILRPGFITSKMLEQVVGEVTIDRAVANCCQTDAKPKAPGMKYRHYAPKATMTIVESSDMEKVRNYILENAKIKESQGIKVGILTTGENAAFYNTDNVISIGNRQDEVSISSHLFEALRRFDELEVDYIYSEAFDRKNFGYAIMNRLQKAAGGNVLVI